MSTTLGADSVQDFWGKIVLVVHHKVGLYFAGTGPLVITGRKRALAPPRVNIDKVPLAFLRPSKGRLAIPIGTMQPARRVTARGDPSFLSVCRLHGLGSGGLNLRRIAGRHLVLSELGSVRFAERGIYLRQLTESGPHESELCGGESNLYALRSVNSDAET